MNPSQKFVYVRTYSRWRDDLGRREEWEETLDRAVDFFSEVIPEITDTEKSKVRKAIVNMDVMPSMRLMWAAGEAARNNHITCYNCSFVAINTLKAFSEALYILMCGTGVGFSVEKKYVDCLPAIQHQNGVTMHFTVEDSKEGWAGTLQGVLEALYGGCDIEVDYTLVRPRGSRLKTMGGRSSGPEPLKDLIEFCRAKIKSKAGRKLTTIDCHDIMCKIAQIVVVGGVRRSSLISLSDLDDHAIATAKVGEFWNQFPYRTQANNSAVYEQKPDILTFMREWMNLIASQAGERGIFSRDGAIQQMTRSGRRQHYADIGTNPKPLGHFTEK